MSAIQLPQELQDLVVDALFDDSRALAVASLVSKIWHRRARHLFFADFWVTISITRTKEREKTDNLADLLESSSSSLARYTRKLRIGGLSLARVPDEDDPTIAQYAALDSYLSRIIPSLTSVKALEVYWMDWDRLSIKSQSLLSGFSEVEALTFENITFADFATGYDTMYGLVRSQTLRRLTLSSICDYNRSEDLTFPEKHHPILRRLHTLTLDLDMWIEARHPLLLPLLSIPCNLHTLDIAAGSEEQIDLINKVLQHLGSNLKVFIFASPLSLRVFNGCEEYDHVNCMRLSLRSNTELERLQLSDFHLVRLHPPQALSVLPRFLSNTIDSVQSGSFKELVFRVLSLSQNIINAYQSPEDIGWRVGRPISSLDAILAGKKSVIPKVRILFKLWDEKASLWKWVKETRRRIAVRAAREFPNLCRNAQLAITIEVGRYLDHFDFDDIHTYGKAEYSDEEEDQDQELDNGRWED